MAHLIINKTTKGQSINKKEKDYEVIYDFEKRDYYYFNIAEQWTGCKFDIGDGYGILKIHDEDITEAIEMTGYYYIDKDGERVDTDEEWWTIDDILKEKFYYQDDDEEIHWDGAYVDLFYEYHDGHNWRKIWLDSPDVSSEEVTGEIGKLRLIATNNGQTSNEYAYISDSGKYYYKYSSFFVGSLDFLEEIGFEKLKTLFGNLN